MNILLISKWDILLLSVGVLIIQWPLAIIAVMKLFKDRLSNPKGLIFWNVFILAVPIIGPVSYLLIRIKSRGK